MTPVSLPPGGSAVLNDRPVACQTRRPTRRETGVSRRLTDEGSLVPPRRRRLKLPGGVSRHQPKPPSVNKSCQCSENSITDFLRSIFFIALYGNA